MLRGKECNVRLCTLVHFAVSCCLFKCEVNVSTLQENEGIYSQLVKDLVTDKSKRLLININDLRRKNPVRAARLVCLATDCLYVIWIIVMWHGGSSAERKYIDKQNGQPVECFCLPWGLSRRLSQLLTIKKWLVNNILHRISEEFFGMIKVCVCGLVHGVADHLK